MGTTTAGAIMSIINLLDAKDYLNVIHDDDNKILQALLDGAEAEALQFMDRTQFGDLCADESSSEPEFMQSDVKIAVLMLLQARYQAGPQDADQIRNAAHSILFPHRCCLGV